jgi:hypothetical protein
MAEQSLRNCMNCSQPMKAISASAYKCTACGLSELGTTQQQQQQPQSKGDPEK